MLQFMLPGMLYCSILGMHIFGCKFSLKTETGDTVPDRKNFDSLLWAIVTVFQVLNTSWLPAYSSLYMTMSHAAVTLGKMVEGDDQNYYNRAVSFVVAFVMVVLKIEATLAAICSQLSSSKQLLCVKTMIKWQCDRVTLLPVYQSVNGVRLAITCYLFVIIHQLTVRNLFNLSQIFCCLLAQ